MINYHDVASLITSISGYAELIERKSSDPKLRNYANKIGISARKLAITLNTPPAEITNSKIAELATSLGFK